MVWWRILYEDSSNFCNSFLEQKPLFYKGNLCHILLFVRESSSLLTCPDTAFPTDTVCWILSPSNVLCTGPLKPKVASKNPWMGDYMQKEVLDKGFNLVMWRQCSLEETSIKWILLFTIGIVQNICNFFLAWLWPKKT